MLKIKGNTITMTRGDTARIEIQMAYDDGTTYEPETGDIIRFTVRKNYADQNAAVIIDITPDSETEDTGYELHIQPTDTRDLAYGKYKFDIQLMRINGDIDTFIDRGEFILTEEVGRYTDSGGAQ